MLPVQHFMMAGSSGDAAVWHDNGYIQIKDRLKDVIIPGGENISSVEVEDTLSAPGRCGGGGCRQA